MGGGACEQDKETGLHTSGEEEVWRQGLERAWPETGGALQKDQGDAAVVYVCVCVGGGVSLRNTSMACGPGATILEEPPMTSSHYDAK